MFSNRICSFKFSKLIDGESSLYLSDNKTLIIPDTPAAARVWPMFGLTLPNAQYSVLVVNELNASFNALISIGSPNLVAVPWAST